METRQYSEEIDLEKYWLVLKRRWFPALLVFSTVLAGAAVYTSMQEPVYEATGKLLFRRDLTSDLSGLTNELGEIDALARNSDPLSTQAEIIRSQPVTEAVVEALDLKRSDGTPMDPAIISGGLTVKPVASTDVLEVSYESSDPEFAAEVVNKVIDEYLKNNIQTNRAEAIAAREFIIKQLPATEAAVSAAEEDLRQFKEQNGIVVLDQEANAAVTAMSNLDRDLTEAEAQLAEVSARATALRSRVGMDTATSLDISALNQSEGVQSALQELQQTQAELASEQTRYRGGHPAIAQLERREDALQDVLQERVDEVLGRDSQVSVGELQIGGLKQGLIEDYVNTEIERLGLLRRINELYSAEAAYRDRSSVLPSLEKTQRELERKLQAAQTTYETLLTRLQEVQVAENQNIGNARVISVAEVPNNPIAPRKALNLAAGGLAGLLLGVAMAFLLDLGDRSVKNLKEARELFGYTLLGVIPAFGKRRSETEGVPRVISRDLPDSPVQAAYQMIQANLKFLNSDHELKTFVVTSSVRGEGRSEVAANLAMSLGQLRRKVLLVDADMRHPSQHRAWDLTNMAGLSNLIVGQVKFSQVVRVISPFLHVLPAGVTPPNPVALLDSSKMDSLIKIFSQNYDYVIFDAPSLAGTADAAVLGKMTDGILFVARPGVVDSGNGRAAKEFLQQSGQNVLGVVVNGVNIKSEPDSYFYYSNQEEKYISNASQPDVEELDASTQLLTPSILHGNQDN